MTRQQARIAIVGAGPASLVTAIAFARRGIHTTLFEREPEPDAAPRYNPNRSYTIDITGHGLKALRYIDACDRFDQALIQFKGIDIMGRKREEWREPGWTGSRGDILRALMSVARERHQGDMTFNFDTSVTEVDVERGLLTYLSPKKESGTAQFDLIIGGDGASSIVRTAMAAQLANFTVTKKTISNYATIIALDLAGETLDKHYLHVLSPNPFCVAGAINGEDGPQTAKWFCMVGTSYKASYRSTEEARDFLRQKCPQILTLTSDKEWERFAQRECLHIGRTLTCSHLFAGKAVLLGDAAAPFPPIGQGINAAMESAMVLDQSVGATGSSLKQLYEAAALYEQRWHPESKAISWISQSFEFGKRSHQLRMMLTDMLNRNILSLAKRSDLPYSDIERHAKRFWPIWAW